MREIALTIQIKECVLIKLHFGSDNKRSQI